MTAERPPCGYPRHRGSEWRLAEGGPVQCGICHPPAEPERVVWLAPDQVSAS